MKIDNLQDLKDLLALCHKQGVSSIKIDGIELQIELKASKSSKVPKKVIQYMADAFDPGQITQGLPNLPKSQIDIIDSNGPTEEQLLFGSADPSVWNTGVESGTN